MQSYSERAALTVSYLHNGKAHIRTIFKHHSLLHINRAKLVMDKSTMARLWDILRGLLGPADP